MKRPAVFFDRDNTLIVNDGYLGDPDGVVLVEGAAELVARVRQLGYAAVTFSNQSGVARGMFTEQDVHRVNSRLDEMLLDHDARAIIDRHEFCPHHPEAMVPRYRQVSEFRKPSPGMIYQAARQLGLDLGRSWVVGDAPRDIEAGRAAGCRTILFTHPTLASSTAASEPSPVEPDFVAASLKEVADLIESNPPQEEESEPSEGVEIGPGEAVVSEAAAQDGVEEVAAGMELPAAVEADEVERGDEVAEVQGSQEQTSIGQDPGLPPAAMTELGSEEQDPASPEPAGEQVMDETSSPGPAPTGGAALEGVRRRSPPAVILAAKAAREAARHSAPDASAEILREVARNAARAAAMGITRDYSAAAPDLPAAAASATPEVAAGEVSAQISQPAAQEPMVEPKIESSRYPEPAGPAYQPQGADPSDEVGGGAGGNLNRLEDIAEQILRELRRRNDAGAEFSVSKVMAGITMVISLALLVYAYLYKDNVPTLQSLLLLGLMLQSITISLLLMGRQR